MSDTPPQPPYGEQQPPYGQPPQPYGAPPPYGSMAVQDHHQSTTVLVLGIVSLVACSILGPFAWVMGNRVVREIDASGGQIGGRSTANAGRICGMIATILLGLGLLFVVVIFVIAIAGASTSTSP